MEEELDLNALRTKLLQQTRNEPSSGEISTPNETQHIGHSTVLNQANGPPSTQQFAQQRAAQATRYPRPRRRGRGRGRGMAIMESVLEPRRAATETIPNNSPELATPTWPGTSRPISTDEKEEGEISDNDSVAITESPPLNTDYLEAYNPEHAWADYLQHQFEDHGSMQWNGHIDTERQVATAYKGDGRLPEGEVGHPTTLHTPPLPPPQFAAAPSFPAPFATMPPPAPPPGVSPEIASIAQAYGVSPYALEALSRVVRNAPANAFATAPLPLVAPAPLYGLAPTTLPLDPPQWPPPNTMLHYPPLVAPAMQQPASAMPHGVLMQTQPQSTEPSQHQDEANAAPKPPQQQWVIELDEEDLEGEGTAPIPITTAPPTTTTTASPTPTAVASIPGTSSSDPPPKHRELELLRQRIAQRELENKARRTAASSPPDTAAALPASKRKLAADQADELQPPAKRPRTAVSGDATLESVDANLTQEAEDHMSQWGERQYAVAVREVEGDEAEVAKQERGLREFEAAEVEPLRHQLALIRTRSARLAVRIKVAEEQLRVLLAMAEECAAKEKALAIKLAAVEEDARLRALDLDRLRAAATARRSALHDWLAWRLPAHSAVASWGPEASVPGSVEMRTVHKEHVGQHETHRDNEKENEKAEHTTVGQQHPLSEMDEPSVEQLRAALLKTVGQQRPPLAEAAQSPPSSLPPPPPAAVAPPQPSTLPPPPATLPPSHPLPSPSLSPSQSSTVAPAWVDPLLATEKKKAKDHTTKTTAQHPSHAPLLSPHQFVDGVWLKDSPFRHLARPAADHDDGAVEGRTAARYISPLTVLRAYRTSPHYFKQYGTLSTPTFSNKLDPQGVLCRYELFGKCNDDECRGQHARNYILSEPELLTDLASYCTANAGDAAALVSQLVKEAVTACPPPSSAEQRARWIVGRLHRDAPARPWLLPLDRTLPAFRRPRLRLDAAPACPEDDPRPEDPSNPPTPPSSFIPLSATHQRPKPADESSRYFVTRFTEEEYEEKVRSAPHSIEWWVDYATDMVGSDWIAATTSTNTATTPALPASQRDKALSVLARGLEANPGSAELWLLYLGLLSTRGEDSREYQGLCREAVKYAPRSMPLWQQCVSQEPDPGGRQALYAHALGALAAASEGPHDPAVSAALLALMLHQGAWLCELGYVDLALHQYRVWLDLPSAPSASWAVPAIDTLTAAATIGRVRARLHGVDRCSLVLHYAYLRAFRLHPPPYVRGGAVVVDWTLVNDSSAAEVFLESLQEYSASPYSEYAALHVNLVHLLAVQGRQGEARTHCRQLLATAATAEVWLLLAWVEQSVCQWAEAGACYEQAVAAASPASLWKTTFAYCTFLVERGDYAKAAQCIAASLQRAVDGTSAPPSVEASLAGFGQLLSSTAPGPAALHREGSWLHDVFCWLCYALLTALPLADPCPHRVACAFELAMAAIKLRPHRMLLWFHYLLYKSLCARTTRDTDSTEARPAFAAAVRLANAMLDELPPAPQYTPPLSVESPSQTPDVRVAGYLRHSLLPRDYRTVVAVARLLVDCAPEHRRSDLYEQLLLLFPECAKLALLAAEYEHARGRLYRVREILRRATSVRVPLEPDADYVALWITLSKVEETTNGTEGARQVLLQATERCPHSRALWLALATAELENGRELAVAAKAKRHGIAIHGFPGID